MIPWAARLLLLLPLLSAAVPAQDNVRFTLRRDQVELCSIEVVPVSSGSKGYGWLRVDVDNLDVRLHQVEVQYRSAGSRGGEVSARRRVDVQPGAHARVFLPLLRCQNNPGFVDAGVDGNRLGSNYVAINGGSPSFLLVAEQDTATMRGLCEAVGARSVATHPGGRTVLTAAVEPAALPTDWPLLSGFDIAMVDGRARVTAEVQETLRRYCAAGGTLAVGYPERLPAGPLSSLLTAQRQQCGLGRILVLDGFAATTPRVSSLSAQLVGLESEAGPVPSGWYTRMQIPGIGEIPGRLFLLVILLFAALVGPVNLWWLRRQKRPMLALVTVPALGFGCTACILLYGLLHDGLGLQGVQRSFTVLDQQQHEAAAIATRTLFAGLSPGPLQVGPAAFVDTPESGQRSLVFDCNAGTVAGTILPSRQPTALVSAQHGVVRARLRFRPAADGGLEALTDGTLQPPQRWLLRDFDGNYFFGMRNSLRRVDKSSGRQMVQETGQSLAIGPDESDVDPIDPYGYRVYNAQPAPANDLDGFLQGQFQNGDLPPGSYLLLTDKAPWIDGFGLDVDWVRSEHWVLGLLAREDFLP